MVTMMNKAQYLALPKHIQARTEIYLEMAKSLSDEWYGMDSGKEVHSLTVQLAAAMMHLESAEVIASEIAEFSKHMKKG